MDKINQWIDMAASVEIGNVSVIGLCIAICLVALICGFLGHLLFGKRSSLNHAFSSTLGILSLYIVGILLYQSELHFEDLLAFLPFVSLEDGYLVIFPILEADFPTLCSQVIRLVIMAFLMNLLDIWIPQGKNILGWILFRILTVFLAMLFLTPIMWFMDKYLPKSIQTIVPVLLFAVHGLSLVVGAMTVNPVLRAVYTFFFASLIGKQISKALLTTLMLVALVYTLNKMGYVVISIASLTMSCLIPIIIVLLLFWYIVGHIL